MTSKSLFFKRMKQDAEQRIWLPAVFFILGFLALEMPLISCLNSLRYRENFAEEMQSYLLMDFFTPNSVFTLMSVCVAIAGAISGFAYIHSARKLDVYHSLPVKRETLFLQQYVYGILYYVIPMILHVLLCVVICGANGVLNHVILGNAMGFALVQVVMYLVCYALSVAVVCLTGNVIISVLGSVILLTYSLLISWLLNALMGTFFTSYYYGGKPESYVPAFSPIHMIYNMLLDMVNAHADYPAYTAYMRHYGVMLLAAVIYTAAALLLYKRRPTEAAASTMAFPIAEPVVKAMVVIPTSVVSGYLFTAIVSNRDDFIWYLLGCICCFIIICPLMEIIFRKDMKAIFSHPLQLVFNAGCVIGILLIFEFDVLGYDSYIPDEKQVESYAVDFSGIPRIWSGDGEIPYGSRLENMEIQDNPGTRSLLEYAAEFSRPMRRGGLKEVAKGELRTTYLEVGYHLKSGKTIYRNYLVNIQDEQVRNWMKDTIQDMQHKLAVYPVLTEGKEENYSGVLVESAFSFDELSLSGDKMQQLVQTYRRELTNLSFEELVNEFPIAKLSFILKNQSEEYGYRIYPSFTRTIELLKEYGVTLETALPAKEIVEIRIEDYTRETSDQNGLLDKVVEKSYLTAEGDDAQIKEIFPNLVYGSFVEGFPADNNAEPNLYVKVTYLEQGTEVSAHFRFKKDRLPQFVVDDLEKTYQEQYPLN